MFCLLYRMLRAAPLCFVCSVCVGPLAQCGCSCFPLPGHGALILHWLHLHCPTLLTHHSIPLSHGPPAQPENLLIDLGGYVKMADFGFVKQVKKGSKTYTLCGTPEYLAPEVIMAKGHGPSADWWALGVLIWELVAGSPPFMDDDRLAMFKKACARQVAWPKHFSPTLRSLLDKLLEPNPLFRLGSGRGGAAEVRQHPWFAGFDWDAFEARRMPAPYVPKVGAKCKPSGGSDFLWSLFL